MGVAFALVPSLAFAQAETTTYRPSAARVEAGSIVYTAVGNLWGVGGTLSVHYAVGEQRLFFFGGRLAMLGGAADGYGGFGGIADADIGLRPRVMTGRTSALALVVGGGVGAAFISDSHFTVALFHLAMRVGPSADLGAFALDVLVGPSLLASDTGAIGAFEGVLDLGLRF